MHHVRHTARVPGPRALLAVATFAAGCGSNAVTGSSFDSGFGSGGGSGRDATTDVRPAETGPLTHPDVADVGVADACAATSAKASVSPLDMYMLLDRSGSMADNNAWTEEVQAIESFVYDVNSVGLGVGFQFLPLPALCDSQAYALPAVPITLLPGGQAQIVSALAVSRPFGGTPLVPALEGAVLVAKQRQMAHPEREIVIVLSSDGLPDTSCSVVPDGGLTNTTNNAISVIQQAAGLVPPIHTFVIGVASEPALDMLAAAGGTGKAIQVAASDAGTAANIEAPLIAALSQIRTNALPCEYSIPQATTGTIDFGQVNVTFTPMAGPAQPFYGVGGASACTTTSSDWYYDNPTTPKHIELCPTACTAVKASTSGSVDVAYGCATLPPPK